MPGGRRSSRGSSADVGGCSVPSSGRPPARRRRIVEIGPPSPDGGTRTRRRCSRGFASSQLGRSIKSGARVRRRAAHPDPVPALRGDGASSTTTIAPWPSAPAAARFGRQRAVAGQLAERARPARSARAWRSRRSTPTCSGASCASAAGATRARPAAYREGSDPRFDDFIDHDRDLRACAACGTAVRAADPPSLLEAVATAAPRSTRSHSSSRAGARPGDPWNPTRPRRSQGAARYGNRLDLRRRRSSTSCGCASAGVERGAGRGPVPRGALRVPDHAGERDRPVSSYDGRLEQAAAGESRRLGLGPVATRRAAGRRGRRRRRGACRGPCGRARRLAGRRGDRRRRARVFAVVLPADLADGAEHRIAVRVAASDYVAPPVLSFLGVTVDPGSPWATTVFHAVGPRRWPSQIWRHLGVAVAAPGSGHGLTADGGMRFDSVGLEIRGDRFHLDLGRARAVGAVQGRGRRRRRPRSRWEPA